MTLNQAVENDLNLFFDLTGAPLNRILNANYLRVGIWIGPKDGWDEKEIEIAEKKDFKIVNLGRLTLRAETATIIASYLISSTLDI